MPKAGFLTPSSFPDLMSNGRGSGEMGQTALRVVDRLAMDMLGVEATEEATPYSCLWGLDNEWLAITTYEERTLRQVRIAGFAMSETHPYIGGTMDGLVGSDGGIEVKCPYSRNEHLANLLDGKQVQQYYPQMQGYMFIYRLNWIDFVSFDPRFPEALQLSVHRVNRDEEYIAKLVARCELANQIATKKARKIEDMKSA